ncbi:voltage-gated chloride channel protein [Streptococcus agalactiae LMG 14747]|uniref:Voltage-gated chloride channel protein n=1 Tax=Streptococcus agalactiae LMG 14747 TaxID=1154860 RepID=V6Z318_STRAG|nr:voltage-gated chloride channel protein [Streptococcus agalactiae LMG 14747]
MQKQDSKIGHFLKLEGCSILVGLSAGLLDVVFGRGLLYVSEMRTSFPYLTIPFLGLAGLIITYGYQRFGGESRKGMGLVFEVGHGQRESIPKRLIPLVIVSTWLTHLFGGSAGREGVAVQLGATLASSLSRFKFLKLYARELLIIGIAAGFGGLFQTPMAATLFAIELLIVGRLSLHLLFPAFTAAYLASSISYFLGLEKFGYLIKSDLPFTTTNITKLLLVGVLFALVGKLFALGLGYLKSRLSYIIANPCLKIFLGGILLSVVLLTLDQGRYSGLGTNLIEASFLGREISPYDWLLKLMITIFTIAIGFQGGEVTPLFAIGTSFGVVIAPLFGLPVDLVAGLGYVAVFAAATNTILGPLMIMGEVFGFANIPYAFVVLVVVSLWQKASSIYSLQQSDDTMGFS